MCEQFEKENCTTLVAVEDADFLIVTTAEKCNLTWRTWIVGEDIDLLVVLNKHKPYNTIYFLKPGKGNIQDSIYDNSFKHWTLEYLLTFIHAFTGCDTTSCFFKQGKNKIIKILLKDSGLQKQAPCFYEPNVTPRALAASACEIVSWFQKPALKGSAKLENFPPTECGTMQHAFAHTSKCSSGKVTPKIQRIGVGKSDLMFYNPFPHIAADPRRSSAEN